MFEAHARDGHGTGFQADNGPRIFPREAGHNIELSQGCRPTGDPGQQQRMLADAQQGEITLGFDVGDGIGPAANPNGSEWDVGKALDASLD